MGHYGSEMGEVKDAPEERRENRIDIDPRVLKRARALDMRESDGPHYEYTDKIREVHNVFAEIEALAGVLRTKLSPVLNDMMPMPTMPMPAARGGDDEDKPTQSELLTELDRLNDHGRQTKRYIENILHEIQL